MPRKLERGLADLGLGGVVVDDVEDDLEARLVKELAPSLELAQHGLGPLHARLAAVAYGACGVKKLSVL